VIHGWRTITPIPLAQACTWDPECVRRAAALAAREARAQGVDWTFAPMVDHCVDARWGRMMETFGESPYESGIFASAAVRGFQGERLGEEGSIAACLKHYVGYGGSEGGRDYSPTDISSQTLWEKHLPSFETGIRAGALTVMSALNDLNGIPTSANHFTLTEVLRDRWRFEGLVVSDWNSVLQLMHQGYAADEAEAVGKAINAGVDLDMADGLYAKHLSSLLDSGRVSSATLDEAVRRVLRVKFSLGLFEHPFTRRSELTEAAPTSEALKIAEEIAGQAIVLLKNDATLPVAPTVKRIAVIGPLAQDSAALLGNWAQQGQPGETPTIFESLRDRFPNTVQFSYERGCSVRGTETPDFSAATSVANGADLIILCLGEEQTMSGENASRSSLRLAGHQEELALSLAETYRPIVLVIVSGRPLELERLLPKMSAIVCAWAGGSSGGGAIADILLGNRNPSGRLAVTWPRSTGQIPLSHNQRPRARLGDEGTYKDIATTPQYEFGYGLSYTTFEYGPSKLDHLEFSPSETLLAQVTVTNTGIREGAETVLWFIRDLAASITRPVKELKHFEKADIPAGQSRVFRFELVPARDLSFPNADGERLLEPGEFILFAGTRQQCFTLLSARP
jgi:beta-glucosidase